MKLLTRAALFLLLLNECAGAYHIPLDQDARHGKSNKDIESNPLLKSLTEQHRKIVKRSSEEAGGEARRLAVLQQNELAGKSLENMQQEDESEQIVDFIFVDSLENDLESSIGMSRDSHMAVYQAIDLMLANGQSRKLFRFALAKLSLCKSSSDFSKLFTSLPKHYHNPMLLIFSQVLLAKDQAYMLEAVFQDQSLYNANFEIFFDLAISSNDIELFDMLLRSGGMPTEENLLQVLELSRGPLLMRLIAAHPTKTLSCLAPKALGPLISLSPYLDSFIKELSAFLNLNPKVNLKDDPPQLDNRLEAEIFGLLSKSSGNIPEKALNWLGNNNAKSILVALAVIDTSSTSAEWLKSADMPDEFSAFVDSILAELQATKGDARQLALLLRDYGIHIRLDRHIMDPETSQKEIEASMQNDFQFVLDVARRASSFSPVISEQSQDDEKVVESVHPVPQEICPDLYGTSETAEPSLAPQSYKKETEDFMTAFLEQQEQAEEREEDKDKEEGSACPIPRDIPKIVIVSATNTASTDADDLHASKEGDVAGSDHSSPAKGSAVIAGSEKSLPSSPVKSENSNFLAEPFLSADISGSGVHDVSEAPVVAALGPLDERLISPGSAETKVPVIQVPETNSPVKLNPVKQKPSIIYIPPHGQGYESDCYATETMSLGNSSTTELISTEEELSGASHDQSESSHGLNDARLYQSHEGTSSTDSTEKGTRTGPKCRRRLTYDQEDDQEDEQEDEQEDDLKLMNRQRSLLLEEEACDEPMIIPQINLDLDESTTVGAPLAGPDLIDASGSSTDYAILAGKRRPRRGVRAQQDELEPGVESIEDDSESLEVTCHRALESQEANVGGGGSGNSKTRKGSLPVFDSAWLERSGTFSLDCSLSMSHDDSNEGSQDEAISMGRSSFSMDDSVSLGGSTLSTNEPISDGQELASSLENWWHPSVQGQKNLFGKQRSDMKEVRFSDSRLEVDQDLDSEMFARIGPSPSVRLLPPEVDLGATFDPDALAHLLKTSSADDLSQPNDEPQLDDEPLFDKVTTDEKEFENEKAKKTYGQLFQDWLVAKLGLGDLEIPAEDIRELYQLYSQLAALHPRDYQADFESCLIKSLAFWHDLRPAVSKVTAVMGALKGLLEDLINDTHESNDEQSEEERNSDAEQTYLDRFNYALLQRFKISKEIIEDIVRFYALLVKEVPSLADERIMLARLDIILAFWKLRKNGKMPIEIFAKMYRLVGSEDGQDQQQDGDIRGESEMQPEQEEECLGEQEGKRVVVTEPPVLEGLVVDNPVLLSAEEEAKLRLEQGKKDAALILDQKKQEKEQRDEELEGKVEEPKDDQAVSSEEQVDEIVPVPADVVVVPIEVPEDLPKGRQQVKPNVRVSRKRASSVPVRPKPVWTSEEPKPKPEPKPEPKPKHKPEPRALTEVELAFSSTARMAAFAPTAPYILSPSVLGSAPLDIFSTASPAVLEHLHWTNETEPSLRRLFNGPKGRQLLKNFRYEGEASACEKVGRLFGLLGGEAIKALAGKCIMLCEPGYFSLITTDDQFQALNPADLLADQVSYLDPNLFSGLTKERAAEFRQTAEKGYYSACAGLTSAQLAHFPSQEVFNALGDVGYAQLPLEELYKAPREVISSLPPSYFAKNLTQGQPGLANLLESASIEQISAIPQFYSNESESPFNGLKMDLKRFGSSSGQEHQRRLALKCLSLQALELVDTTTLASFGAGDFAHLSEDLKKDLSAESFSHIPAEAIPFAEVSKLSVQNTKVCSQMRPEHFSGADSILSITPLCASMLPTDTWRYLTESGESLPTDFLALVTSDHLSELPKASTSGLKASHWRKLGDSLAEEAHPCEALSLEQVADNKEFWKGINMGCFVSLPFMEDLKTEQIKHVKKNLLEHLPTKIFARLSDKLKATIGSGKIDPALISPAVLNHLTPEELGSLDAKAFAKLPLSTLSSLNSTHAAYFGKNSSTLLEQVTHEIVAALAPDFLASLPPSLIAGIRPSACSGLSRDHLAHLHLSLLPAVSFAFILPDRLADLTALQLSQIPEEAWTTHLTSAHIKAIRPDIFAAGFKRFELLGTDVDPLSPHHPCMGVTSGQRVAIGPAGNAAFMKQCKPVFDSQELEKSTPAV